MPTIHLLIRILAMLDQEGILQQKESEINGSLLEDKVQLDTREGPGVGSRLRKGSLGLKSLHKFRRLCNNVSQLSQEPGWWSV